MKLIHYLMAVLVLAACLAGVASANVPPPVSVNAGITSNGANLMETTAPSYFDVLINSQVPVPPTPDDSDIKTGKTYLSWCVDAAHGIADGSYDFTVYSSLDYNAFPADSYMKTLPEENWNKINYIINHKEIANNNARAIQAAIWHFDGGIPVYFGTPNYDSWFTGADYDAIVAAANANGGSYHPTAYPEVYAAVLVPPISEEQVQDTQICIIEIPCDFNVPEFPSIYLPAGMLIGMVFLVSMLRKRE